MGEPADRGLVITSHKRWGAFRCAKLARKVRLAKHHRGDKIMVLSLWMLTTTIVIRNGELVGFNLLDMKPWGYNKQKCKFNQICLMGIQWLIMVHVSIEIGVCTMENGDLVIAN